MKGFFYQPQMVVRRIGTSSKNQLQFHSAPSESVMFTIELPFCLSFFLILALLFLVLAVFPFSTARDFSDDAHITPALCVYDIASL